MSGHLQLQDVFKAYTYDQDKVLSPEETVAHVRQLFTNVGLDILEKTMRIDTGRLDIPVYISLCGTDAVPLTGTKKQMGKGGTPIQAEASALMELAERFSFFSFIKNTHFPMATYADTDGSKLPLEHLWLALHDNETDLEKAGAVLRDLPFRWTRAFNLSRNVDMLIPIDWFYTIHEYNGPAAGNALEEAILQSLCEVVERHVSSVISHDRLTLPSIDPSSVQDPAAKELLDKFAAQSIEVFIKDFSLETGIPTIGTLAWDPGTFPERSEIVFTAGTTTDPEKSLIRALTEIAQLAGDFQNRTSYRPTLPKYKSLEDADYITAAAPTVSVKSLPNLSHDSFKTEIERCVTSLSRLGLEVLVIDVTHPQLGIPSVYTVIPGAHFRDRTRDTTVLFHAAKILSQTLDGPQAASGIQRLLDAFPDRYDLHFFMGLTLEYQGIAQEALKQFRTALDLDPRPVDIASVHTHIGVCLKDLQDYRGAIKALEEARVHDPSLKEIYNLLGFCYFKLKEHQRSIEQFEKALEIDPGSAIDYANIGSNLREMGHKEEAIRLYHIALELDPSIDFARDSLTRLEKELAVTSEG
ncbi:MAG: YcaO-like family protein [Deltaproteobacteria bacterium]|nr:MAG: YcaO-like family protein [Deltaproteobacteria bacterium]